MTPITYTRMSEAVHETPNFEVFVGIGNKPMELPKYLVRSKAFDVIEFESESLYMARGWANFFDNKTDEAPEVEEINFPDNVTPITRN